MKRRGVIQNSALALFGDLATKVATFAFLALAAHSLSVRRFALLASAVASATVLTAALDMGAQVLLTRDGSAGPEQRGALLLALTKARLPLLAVTVLGATVVGLATGHLLIALATVLLAFAGTVQQTLSGVVRSAQNLLPEALAKLANAAGVGVCALLCLLLRLPVPAILIGLAAACLLSLGPLVTAGRAVVTRATVSPWPALKRALPLGLMALATLVYYRSGTIVLSIVSSPRQTALFAAASTVGFGLLSFSNAVTTGLLPRLSARREGLEPARLTLRALFWTVVVASAIALILSVLARPLMEVAFGHVYADAATPMVLLAGASVLIGASGILGTALIAAGCVRIVAVQVGVTLVVNLALLALLAPGSGATGAAIATLGCETIGLLVLVRAAWLQLPGVIDLRWRMPLRRLFLIGASR
jgi:O-antigen/teichoic acid export membrane protein